MSDDWRAQNAWNLRRLTLHFSEWTRAKPDWDHDHCAGCWAKFADFDAPDIQRAGYTTGDDYRHGARYEWVCEECFRELKDVMGWKCEESR